MAYSTVDALILRETRYKESDRILTLFTPERGIITAKARGALRKNSKLSAATQFLTYSELTLFDRLGLLEVREAVIREPFDGLRKDFEKYALGCYFAQCVEGLLPEGEADTAILQLVLNSLYALSHSLYESLAIKAAFEIRLMCLLGYTPDLTACVVCGREDPASPVFGLQTGHICCRNCQNASTGTGASLDEASLEAMRYIVSAPAKQLFSFRLERDALKRLNDCSERYLTEQAGRRFDTLDYWKKIRL